MLGSRCIWVWTVARGAAIRCHLHGALRCGSPGMACSDSSAAVLVCTYCARPCGRGAGGRFSCWRCSRQPHYWRLAQRHVVVANRVRWWRVCGCELLAERVIAEKYSYATRRCCGRRRSSRAERPRPVAEGDALAHGNSPRVLAPACRQLVRRGVVGAAGLCCVVLGGSV